MGTPQTIYLKDYTPPSYRIESTDLLFKLHEENSKVVSKLRLTKNTDAAVDALRLDGEGLTLESIKINGESLSDNQYKVDGESLTLLNPPSAFTLETQVQINPETNTSLEGLYRSSKMFCTQCEAEGFRKITWYLDRPDVMSVFTVRIEADKERYPILLSNGNPTDAGDLAGLRHFAEWHDPFPKPSYLFALVAGDLENIADTHTTPSGRKIDLRIYTEKENIDKCDHAMRSLIAAMKWDEQQYGREYDLDIYNVVAVNDFNMGAMENKGLNIFNSSCVLARPDTATDYDFQRVEGVVAHEYFHNWTGNRITCRDWFQLSLKEGLTVFRDQEFSADMNSRGVKRIDDVRTLRHYQFAEDESPMAHPVRPASYIEINNFYTATVYEKGAEVVRMQATLLGDKYREATDLYFERHDGQAVTTDDFVACMAETLGRDLEQFKRWYQYAGTPVVSGSGEYDDSTDTYQLTLQQRIPDTPGQTDKPPLHIPVRIGLLGRDGSDINCTYEGTNTTATEHLVELVGKSQTFVFTDVPTRPVPSLFRGFSAPVRLEFEETDEDLMFLMAHDSDGFNQWDAAQTLAERAIKAMLANGCESVPEVLLRAFENTLNKDVSDPALATAVLGLPSIGYLGTTMETIDIEGLDTARHMIAQAVGNKFGDRLLEIYDGHHDTGDYSLAPEAMGRRQLKNRALSYLVAAENEKAIDLCFAQYNAQHNMTDVIGALQLIADLESREDERANALAHFSEKWMNEPLVLNKWYSVQATSRRADTLNTVKALTSHEKFSFANPNRVRALIGAFAGGNPLRFHAADGSGYAFYADQVIHMDKINPQVAARLLRVMSSWRQYDKTRQASMRKELERIKSAAKSADVFEIASKSLED